MHHKESSNIILHNNIFHSMTCVLYKILVIFIFTFFYISKNLKTKEDFTNLAFRNSFHFS